MFINKFIFLLISFSIDEEMYVMELVQHVLVEVKVLQCFLKMFKKMV
jgi:hypothetical protein